MNKVWMGGPNWTGSLDMVQYRDFLNTIMNFSCSIKTGNFWAIWSIAEPQSQIRTGWSWSIFYGYGGISRSQNALN